MFFFCVKKTKVGLCNSWQLDKGKGKERKRKKRGAIKKNFGHEEISYVEGGK